MRKGKFVILCVLTLLAASFACSKEKAPATKKPAALKPAEKPETQGPQTAELKADDEVAVISTDFGRIILRFFPGAAPGHVSNFKSLARSKFYDGTIFHRVIPGFMIQGGDPNSRDDNQANDGGGRGPRLLKAEFSRIPHEKGIVSMARSRDPNSASCQFFILVGRAPHLDGQYSVFGKVVKGIEAVDKIVALPRNEGDNPGKAAVIHSITVERAGDVLDFPLS
ncbi:MAG: peptidylprolyl isomerase [Gemmatimonadota bacterium]|nr:peptidylprolyl isomerase [Gemmatimonadota bacterium]